jgi:hypothetical protein
MVLEFNHTGEAMERIKPAKATKWIFRSSRHGKEHLRARPRPKQGADAVLLTYGYTAYQSIYK